MVIDKLGEHGPVERSKEIYVQETDSLSPVYIRHVSFDERRKINVTENP